MIQCLGRQKFLRAVLVRSLVIIFIFASVASIYSASHGQRRNLIVMVYDGQSTGAITLTRWYKKIKKLGDHLAMDRMRVRLCSTHMEGRIITDSAAAATAFATGHKTRENLIALSSDFKELKTILEKARDLKKATGIISTSCIQHATPAAFSAHVCDRHDYRLIARKQVDKGIDVVLGGGSKFLLPETDGGKRKDKKNLVNIIKEKKYKYISSLEELKQVDIKNTNKLWGMFDHEKKFKPYEGDLAYDFDRKVLYNSEPSLEEMTETAIHILSKNPKGFFLFVEGSKVDWASHANDPVGVISDMLAFDKAVEKALNFALDKNNGETLVLVFPDHNCGGMTIGNSESDESYKKITTDMTFKYIKKARLTAEGVHEKLYNASEKKKLSKCLVKKIIKEFYGIDDLTLDEAEGIFNHLKTKKAKFTNKLGELISKRSYIGWTTHGHVGDDVPFHYFGVIDINQLLDKNKEDQDIIHLDNTDIEKICNKFINQ